MNGSLKIVYVVLAVLFLMLGVVGLLIPIIPGILFLALAVYLLSRVSRRVHAFTQRDPRLREMQQRLDRFGDVAPMDRVRLGAWMALDTLVKGAAMITNGIRRMVSR